MFNYWILLVFLAYFASLIGIAVFYVGRMRTMSDYVLGGRRADPATAGLSAGSSTCSAWTVLVFPALAFQNGLVEIWTALAVTAGIWVAWTVMAKRLRRYTIATGDSLTLPAFLEKRFGDNTREGGLLRTLAGFVTLVFTLFYISSGMIAGSKLMGEMFGIGDIPGLLVTCGAVVLYSFMGGFEAISKTDVIQALVMLSAFIILPITLILVTDTPFTNAETMPPRFWNPLVDSKGNPITVLFILSAAGWGFGYLGSQQMVPRFMSLESEDAIVTGRRISTAWMGGVFGLGLLAGLLAGPALDQANLTGSLSDPERVYLLLSETFFHPLLTGLLLTAVTAAIKSTADSQLLVAASVLADDIPFMRAFSSSLKIQAKIWLNRFLLLVAGAGSVALAIVNPESVANMVSYAWGGLGAAFGPVTILALYWRRFNVWGAIASIVTGTALASVWGYLSGGPVSIWDVEPATAGFILTFPVAVIVTRLTAEPSEEVVELFDRIAA